MATQRQKRQTLKELKPRIYKIYGIFNFKTKELVSVGLNQEEVELRFDLEDYDENYDVVSFDIAIH